MVLNGAMELTTSSKLQTAGLEVSGTHEELALMPVDGFDTCEQDTDAPPVFIFGDDDDLDDEDDFEDEDDYEDEEEEFEEEDELEEDEDDDEEEYDEDEEDDDYDEDEDEEWDDDYE